MRKIILLVGLMVLSLMGCSTVKNVVDPLLSTATVVVELPTQTPTSPYLLGEQLLVEPFDIENAWESYQDDSNTVTVKDGKYQMEVSTNGYIWGLNEADHTDVVIEVTAAQLSGPDNNAYGVICRADMTNNGDGYYFLVSGDGGYHIGKGTGDEIVALVEWDSAVVINEGAAVNTLRATCIGDKLSLYVNDQLMAEATDSEYTSGYTGLTVAVFEEEMTANVSFDDLTIWAASAQE